MKLHLGCGKRDFGPDWVHIDKDIFPHITHHDVCHLPYDDDSVDLIYACHLIAYFDRWEIVPILREWKRVLKPGGVLRLATPDFDELIALKKVFPLQLNPILGPLYGRMYVNGQFIYHKTCYDAADLKSYLLFAGFSSAQKYDWRKTEHAQFDDHSQAYIPHLHKDSGTLISLNMEAVK